MKARPYAEVDVFSQEPCRGNALAVVHDADGLSAEEMQRFASWTNSSETGLRGAAAHPLRTSRRNADPPDNGGPPAGPSTCRERRREVAGLGSPRRGGVARGVDPGGESGE